MEGLGKFAISKLVIAWEAAAFLFIIILDWLDEIIDIPYLMLGAESTPINWRESLFESVLIAMLGVVIILVTSRLLNQMKSLEGILPICANCKKIRDEKDNWRQIEAYIRDRSEADFSHSICPECMSKLYPEMRL